MKLSRRSFMAGVPSATALSACAPWRLQARPDTGFPKDFIWGVSTSSHQVEGGAANNDFWFLEHLADTPFVEPSGDAVDQYHLYKDDIRLMKALGIPTYRFSMEWSRIEPEQGVFSAAALQHYRRVAETCLENGVDPYITLNHFTVPLWFAKRGGWEASDAPDLFARYAEWAAAALGDVMRGACTLNEPNITVQGAYFARRNGQGPAGDENLMARAARAAGSNDFSSYFFVDGLSIRDNFLQAHKKGYAALKSGPGDYPVGMSLALRDYQVADGSATAEEIRRGVVQEGHVAFYEAAQHDDYVGVQTYSRRRINADGVMRPPEGAKLTQMGVEFYPEALGATVREAWRYTKRPILVSENGVPTDNDTDRIQYIDTALEGLRGAIHDGVDVRGYIYWSFLDNYEWMSGYGPKFGLVSVDRTTQQRTPKPSAYHFARLIRSNGAALTPL